MDRVAREAGGTSVQVHVADQRAVTQKVDQPAKTTSGWAAGRRPCRVAAIVEPADPRLTGAGQERDARLGARRRMGAAGSERLRGPEGPLAHAEALRHHVGEVVVDAYCSAFMKSGRCTRGARPDGGATSSRLALRYEVWATAGRGRPRRPRVAGLEAGGLRASEGLLHLVVASGQGFSRGIPGYRPTPGMPQIAGGRSRC